jgi:hypothetical protein
MLHGQAPQNHQQLWSDALDFLPQPRLTGPDFGCAWRAIARPPTQDQIGQVHISGRYLDVGRSQDARHKLTGRPSKGASGLFIYAANALGEAEQGRLRSTVAKDESRARLRQITPLTITIDRLQDFPAPCFCHTRPPHLTSH